MGKKSVLFLIHFLPRGLCLENSPRILKVPSTLNSGFFLFTPLIMNSLALRKGEQNQHRFFLVIFCDEIIGSKNRRENSLSFSLLKSESVNWCLVRKL